MTTSSELKTAIAVNRFGLGVRPDETLPADPKVWLLAQFERYEPRPAAWAAEPAGAQLVTMYADYQRERRQATADSEVSARQKLRQVSTDRYRSAVNARVTSALVDTRALRRAAGALLGEPLRGLGREDPLVVARRRLRSRSDPAACVRTASKTCCWRSSVIRRCCIYLDQVRSIGPGSIAAQRRARNNPDNPRGLNENLAREILELHTLGVRSGYSRRTSPSSRAR